MASSAPSTSRLPAAAPSSPPATTLATLNTTTHYPPTRVTQHLQAASSSATASDDTFRDATESSLEWLISLAPRARSTRVLGAEGKGKGKGVQDLDAEAEHVVHWYCGSDGAEECWDSAVFLIRLFAFKKTGDVEKWRDLFQTYLRLVKPEKVVDNFLNGLEKAELQAVIASLTDSGLTVLSGPDDPLPPPATVTLSSVPPATIYNILINPRLFQRPDLVNTIISALPPHSLLPLPPVVSPGLLAFLFHSSLSLREWAQSQLHSCDMVPVKEYAANGLGFVVDSHLGVLASRDKGEGPDLPAGLGLEYTDNRRAFWQGMGGMLSVLTAEVIRDNLVRRESLAIVQFVAGHVGDEGHHFEAVLNALRILFDSLGHHFWASGDDEYPQTILHSILDNPEFERAFVQLSSSSPDQPFLDWLPPFLNSVSHSAETFSQSLAIVASTLLDRFQKARFEISPRTTAINLALNVFSEIFVVGSTTPTSSNDSDPFASKKRWPHAQEAAKVLDLHAGFIAQLAFSSDYSGDEWSRASEAAVNFVGRMAKKDSDALVSNVYALATFGKEVKEEEAKRKAATKRQTETKPGNGSAASEVSTTPTTSRVPPPPFLFARALWEKSYSLVRDTDARGIGAILRGISSSSHLESLSSSTWSIKSMIRSQMKAVNDAISEFRHPLIPLLMSLADERTDLLLDFLAQSGIAEHVTVLLLSPVEEVHNTAQGLIKQTFDVTTRRECLRSLIFQFPDATFRGLSHGIKAFVTTASLLPEACSMAKRIVRCLSDVIDVLCGATDGLLRDDSFLKRSEDIGLRSKLVSFWKMMCDALALLFKQTPEWATYFENEQMTEWMRDALLFGVDLLEQFRTFEMCATRQILDTSTGSHNSPKKTSRTGERMIQALNEPLEELTAWLRLNDEDLLSSSFDLVRSMVDRFSRSQISIRASTITKLKKITERESKSRAQGTPRSSLVRDDQLRGLIASLAIHDPESREGSGSDTSKQSHKDWWAKAQASKKTTVRGKKGEIETIQIDSDDDDEPRKPSQRSSSSLVGKSTSSSSSSAHSKLPNPHLRLPFGSYAKTAAPSSRLEFPPTIRPFTQSKPAKNKPPPARPRGVPWTTYSSKAVAAVPSSDSESSDEDDTGGPKLSGLALLARAQGSPKIKKTIERRAVKLLSMDTEGSRKTTACNIRQEQQQKAARLRGVQDFAPLHRQILQWDVEHDSNLPPSMTQNPPGVPTTFESPEAYFAAFEPLLLVECWEQIRQAKTEASKESQPVQCEIAGRQAVDDFTDIFLTIANGKLPERTYFGESDLVLLRQGKRQALAKVQSAGRRREFFELTLRCHFGSDKTDVGGGLQPRTQWEVVKLYTLSTIHREYSALQSLPYLELFSDIINPRPPPIIEPDSRLIAKAMSDYQVNKPQAAAILGSLKHRGFSLIQGPPGTGKTKTIVGLIGAFMDSRPRPASLISVGRPTDPLAAEPVAKVLLCAPSNAAVDEVAKRLKDGIRGHDGKLYIPKVVRIGSDSSVDISVKDIFLDELVERELSGASNGAGTAATTAQANMHSMRAEVDALRGERDSKKLELDNIENNNARKSELAAQLKTIKGRIFELSQKLDSEKDKAQQSRRAMDAQQRKVRLKILSEADVICATLSGSGHDYMAQLPFDFETVIIDEAAQSIELSSLIPLKYGCRRCILVGDPLQLPPTVISRTAAQAGYERSLFVRVMERGGSNSVHLLSIQYRMHSHISAFPSTAFYHSRLIDGPNMDSKTLQPWHACSLFPPYRFMHVRNGTEVSGRHHSLSNPAEAATALAIYERLLREYPDVNFDYRIGIVTPYKGQVGELKKVFRNKFGLEIMSKVSFNTVDGFQGQEKDIIILSCVRGGSADNSVGFLADTRRMNVALTRARSSLFILGDSKKLRSNKYWCNLVDDAQSRGLLSEVDPSTFRSLAPAGPPTVTKSTNNPANISKAKPISIAPPMYTPKQISAQAGTGGGGAVQQGGGGIKKRLGDQLIISRTSEEEERARKKSKIEEPVASSSAAKVGVPIATPVTAAPRPPKKAASLFVPKKRPAPTSGVGPSTKKQA